MNPARDLMMNGKTFLFQQLSEEDSRRLDSLYNVATRSQDAGQCPVDEVDGSTTW
jgi:hypothetical protein